MIVQQATAPAAPAIRQQMLPTGLGPCMVGVQQGADGRHPASSTPDVYLHGAAGTWTTFLPLLAGTPARDRVLIDLPGWGASTQDARLEHLSPEAMSRAVTGILGSLG